jgi:hypothetical protein
MNCNTSNKPKFVTHTTSVAPAKMGKYILPQPNYNMYKENYGNYVFATSSRVLSKAYFFLSQPCMYMFTYQPERAAVIIKDWIFFYEFFRHAKGYIYYIPSDNFAAVVRRNEEFGYEWVAKNKVSLRTVEGIKEIKLIDIITKNEIGNPVDVFFASDEETYVVIKEELKKISNYHDKFKYLLDHNDGKSLLNLTEKNICKRLQKIY